VVNKAQTVDHAEELGRAWAMHRNGNQNGAAEIFKNILIKSPSNLDAMYGLGLAQRAAGQNSEAIETFDKALAGVHTELQQNPGEDRLEILERMLNQRLAELRAITK